MRNVGSGFREPFLPMVDASESLSSDYEYESMLEPLGKLSHFTHFQVVRC